MGKHPPSTQKQPAKSYVEASLDHNDRYPGVAMAKDGVPRRAWRKGSQWFAMTREHATIVAEDVEVFEAFEKHCNVTARRAAGGGGGGGDDDDAATSAHTGANGWSTFCAPDEHYIPTLFALRGIERELEGRGVTYTNWWPTTRAHPKLYAVQESREAIANILGKRELDVILGANVS